MVCWQTFRSLIAAFNKTQNISPAVVDQAHSLSFSPIFQHKPNIKANTLRPQMQETIVTGSRISVFRSFDHWVYSRAPTRHGQERKTMKWTKTNNALKKMKICLMTSKHREVISWLTQITSLYYAIHQYHDETAQRQNGRITFLPNKAPYIARHKK